MSRSRRPRKLEKCCCGRHLIPFIDGRRGETGCTILEYVHEHNNKFLKFRERRSQPPVTGDEDG